MNLKPTMLMRSLFAAVLACVASIAWSQSSTCAADADCITVTYPTAYTDGSPLPATDLDGGILEFKTATGWQHLTKLTYPTTTYTRQPVTGQHTYRWRVLTKAGGFSAFVETLPKEPAPGTIRVVDNRAYKHNDGYVDQVKIEQIGFVPVDTRCTEHIIEGLHVVAIGKRTLVGGKASSQLVRNASGAPVLGLPKQVLAKCELQS